MANRSDRPDPEKEMPFGRYRGSRLCDLPRDYLEWLLTLDGRYNPTTADIKAAMLSESERQAIKSCDVWLVLQEQADAHKQKFPGFAVDRFMASARKRGESWAWWALDVGVARANKSLRVTRSINRYAESQD